MPNDGVTVDQQLYVPEALIDVDPPAPAAEAQKAEENTSDPAPPADDKKPEEVTETPEQQEQKRQSRRARARERAAAELAAAQTEARLLREQLARLDRPTSPESSGEPKREDFPDDWTFLEKRTEWIADQKVEQRLKAEREAREASERQTKAKTQQEQVAQEWEKREREFRAKTPDYVDVVTPFVEREIGAFADPARQAIIESGPQVLHYLATHPDEVERISALPQLRQASEIFKLEDAVNKPAPKRVSKAPDPITPLPQGRSAPNGYSDNMTDSEYREWRKSQGARWAR